MRSSSTAYCKFEAIYTDTISKQLLCWLHSVACSSCFLMGSPISQTFHLLAPIWSSRRALGLFYLASVFSCVMNHVLGPPSEQLAPLGSVLLFPSDDFLRHEASISCLGSVLEAKHWSPAVALYPWPGGTRHIASFFCSIFRGKPCAADMGLGGFATENRISEFLSANLCSHLLSYSASP